MRRSLWVLYAGFPLLVGLVAVMDKRSDWYSIKAVVALLYLGLIVALQFKLSSWPCPHCGRAFFGGWNLAHAVRFFTIAERKCAHCGLRWHETSQQPSVTV
jgi:predicted RNA-binding Zn-ribbon protein involved in translation (DUF1610 family)